jgi:hypothetical protein
MVLPIPGSPTSSSGGSRSSRSALRWQSNKWRWTRDVTSPKFGKSSCRRAMAAGSGACVTVRQPPPAEWLGRAGREPVFALRRADFEPNPAVTSWH